MQQVSDMRPTYQSRPTYKAEVDGDAYYNAASVRYAADLPIRLKSLTGDAYYNAASDRYAAVLPKPTFLVQSLGRSPELQLRAEPSYASTVFTRWIV